VPASDFSRAAFFPSTHISPALGLIPDTKYTETSVKLYSGDEIVLYTDGVIEAAIGNEEFSEKRLVDFLVEHRNEDLNRMLDSLIQSVQAFTQRTELDDDACLIGLRIG
jgi:sigma-B regulation protein RsbU (phosphoserine phosphatase)